jgi:hypothetical protein
VALAEALLPNTSMLYRLQDFRVYEPVASHELLKYFERLDTELLTDIRSRFYLFTWKPRVPLLSVAGVRWVLAPEDDSRVASPALLAQQGLVHRLTADGMEVWENPNARPWAYLAQRVAEVRTQDEALSWVAEHAADPDATVMVMPPAEPGLTTSPSTRWYGGLPANFRQRQDGARATVRAEASHAGRSVLQVSAPSGGLLVVGDLFYPGWTATVDGSPARVLHTNYLFMGVEVSPGDHSVVLEYRPAAFMAGLALSAVSLGLVAVGLIVLFLRRRSFEPELAGRVTGPGAAEGAPEGIG